MKKTDNKMNGFYKTGSLLIVFLFSTFLAISQDFPPWPASDDALSVQNPVPVDKTSLEAGKALFDLQCKACHGETGKGDGLIKSANLTTAQFAAQSDGEVFWKLQTGRGQMPSFKALPVDQLWSVINYVRSFTAKRENFVMKNAAITLAFNTEGETRKITAKVEQVADDGTKSPASGINVKIGAKSYFGILPASKSSVYTNDEGLATIDFPNNFIGDENGELTIIASIEDMEYNPVHTSETITWGLVNPKDYWTERRALWKNNDHIPIWLLTSFIIAALAIWGTIGYVALLVRKIKVEGDKIS